MPGINRLSITAFLSALFAFGLWTCGSSTKSENHSNQEAVTDTLTDEALLDLVERRTFRYFWDGAEPNSGMACERIHMDGVYPMNDQRVVATGGSGFGIMAIIAATEREYITREQALDRLEQIADFLKHADRFHGAWSHWIYGETGKVKPFSRNDDGGDIVETSFLTAGMLCARQYFQNGNAREQRLARKLDTLWREVDWNWYRGPDRENVLFWHWSPVYQWEKQHRITGYNECLITYVMAASSPTHPVPPEVYHEGWARNGEITGGPEKYGYSLALEHNGAPEYGGPLFWAHYSFLGLDPRNLRDQYADYWEHNRNHVLINRAYCIENPENYEGYGEMCWGLTSSYSIKGYAGHKPGRDLGVIAPTAALSSIVYTPEYSMDAMRYFYSVPGDKLFGEYGFYDAFSIHHNWFPEKYLAIDQGPVVVMIENYRSGLLWDLFMSSPEVQQGLDKLGFEY